MMNAATLKPRAAALGAAVSVIATIALVVLVAWALCVMTATRHARERIDCMRYAPKTVTCPLPSEFDLWVQGMVTRLHPDKVTR